MKTSIITGIALTFVHRIGEFGIVIMVEGNIFRETRVASKRFQNYVLFPNTTVEQNISFAQKEKNQTVVDELLERLEDLTLFFSFSCYKS